MAVTVERIVQRVKTVLMEVSVDGIRWTNDELVNWLNEAYSSLVGIRPDASTVNESLALAEDTKQAIPSGGVRLIDVVRNLAGAGGAIRQMDRKTLDWGRPGWHGETPTLNIEFFIFDEMDPTNFYVYPPADDGAEVEVIYSVVPDTHDTTYNTSKVDVIKVGDQFAPALVDYILYRAFGKDNEAPNAANRSVNHYQSFEQGLGVRYQVAQQASPNTQAPGQRFNK